MQKLIQTTGLFLLLFVAQNSFAGGFEKVLLNVPFRYQYPTKDGGVLIFGDNGLSTYFSVTKIDKFGNYVFNKYIYSRIDSINNTNGTSVTEEYLPSYQDGENPVKNIIEIKPDIYVIEHNGKTRKRTLRDPNTFQYITIQDYDYSKIRTFTTIDKYGNVLKTCSDIRDTIYPGYNTNDILVYDSIANNVVLGSFQSLNTQNNVRIRKNVYDTAFNLLSSSYYDKKIGSDSIFFLVSNITSHNNNYYCQYFDAYTGNNNFIFKLDSNFNIVYKKKIAGIDAFDSLSVATFLPNYTASVTSGIGVSDKYIDDSGNVYYVYMADVSFRQFTPVFDQKDKMVLCIVKLNIQGDIVFKSIQDISSNFQYSTRSNLEPILIFPYKNRFNIIHLDGSLYTKMVYDIPTNKLISISNQQLPGNNGYKLRGGYFILGITNSVATRNDIGIKSKSPYDNGYSSVFLYGNQSGSNTNGIIKFDSLGNAFQHIIQGNVFADQNGNCIKNSSDKNLPQITVTATGNNYSTFTSSDNNGNYQIGIGDSGTYLVNARTNINYPLFTQGNCAQGTSYSYLDSFTVDTVNLALKPTILCPNMYVDISAPFLRRCFPNTYTVNYKNNGTITSPDTYVDITLDRFLTVNSASRPYSNLGNNVLRFQLGNVDYLSSGSFRIDVTVNCDSTVIGQTHCATAHIYPDTVCAVSSYTGPVISATAKCKVDSVEFKLRNTGGNMPTIKRYIVIEDNLNRINGNYQLNANQEKIVTIAADSGHTYGIIAEQDAAFPPQLGDLFASAFIEGCNATNGNFTTGIITQYPEFDGQPYASTDCQQNIGSYDPNDKTGYPIGVSGNHTIEKNTALDYHINFQNTGTDTAFRVVIVDTISKYLNINTIEPGASSHRYTYMRTDSNVIKFIFDSINLVDSNKNERLSHGFVKFRIQQKPNNANGTKIYNEAQIYFDYNSPIFTNRTMHTIGEIYVRILSSVIRPNFQNASIKVYPNPFRENAIIELQNLPLQKTTLSLIDITGKEMMRLQSDINQYQIDGRALEKGMYLFKITNEHEEIAEGKLIVQ